MILTDKRTLVAKIEATPGTQETLANANFDCLVRDIKMSPEIETYGRKYATGDHGWHPSVMGKSKGTITFSFDLQYSGTPQTPPKWSKFLQGAGLVETVNGTSGVRWMPDVLNDTKSLTIFVQDIQSGATPGFLQYKFKGCMASAAKIVMAKLGEPLRCEMTFTGCFTGIADQANGSLLVLTSPDTALPDAVISATITKGAVAQRIGKMELDLAPSIGMLFDPADATGYKQAFIAKREAKLSMDPETQLIAADPVYTQWAAGTTFALSLATANFTIATPVAQHEKVGIGDREGHAVYESTYRLARSAGNDEFKVSQAVGG